MKLARSTLLAWVHRFPRSMSCAVASLGIFLAAATSSGGEAARSPTIILAAPQGGQGAARSPFELKILFRAHGGAQIDPDSVIVYEIVMRLGQPISVDRTSQFRPFITADGIYVANIDWPPGLYELWIMVKDTHGQRGSADITFTIAQ